MTANFVIHKATNQVIPIEVATWILFLEAEHHQAKGVLQMLVDARGSTEMYAVQEVARNYLERKTNGTNGAHGTGDLPDDG